MGQRGPQAWSKDRLKLGVVRIRNRGTHRVRMIKINDTGPISGRWVNYARWWWEQNRRPVPEGYRVAHLDGDTLNDAPANYGLLTGGEVALLHLRNKKVAKRMRRRRKAAMARFNQEKGRVAFFRRATTQRWYPADVQKRVVYYVPRRTRNEVFEPWLGAIRVAANGVILPEERARIEALHLVAVRGSQLREPPYDTFKLRAWSQYDRRTVRADAALEKSQ